MHQHAALLHASNIPEKVPTYTTTTEMEVYWTDKESIQSDFEPDPEETARRAA